ncbi:MAG: hypothetical protein NWE76_04540 [Candidatus Bathyarchaeota archaeon]|nr:hypothetical protein [Candidatus Bathyarchaeota archaeon]
MSGLVYQVDSVELTLYRDGLVHVTQALTVNETYPSASFPLLASSIENILALDENQTLLDYETDGPQITVFTLGSTRVFLEYDTISITRKEAEVWTLNLTGCPYNLTVCLPEESTIVYLNQLPTSIDTEDGKITLALFPSDWEISYVLPIIIPASFTISDLTVTPSEVEAGDEVTISATVTNVGGTEGSYTVALEVDGSAEQSKTVTLAAGASTSVKFRVTQTNAGTYSVKVGELQSEFVVSEPAVAFRITDLTVTPEEAEAGSQVTVSMTVTNEGEAEGSYSVVLNINGAEENTETVVLAGGASTTVEFTVTRTEEGTYSVQVDDLQGQFTIRPPPARFPMEYLIVIAIAVIVACGLIFLRKRGPKAGKILKERPELRQEDREVIEFISERGGKVLEAEIREAFPDLPRTTLWRLVRRLEKMDIVSVKKIGLQNQIELKK